MPLLTTKTTPPGGFTFKEPKTKWSVRDPMLPFDEVVKQIARHREANATIFSKEELDYDVIADALEEQVCKRLKFNSNWCRSKESLEASSPPPPPEPTHAKQRNSRAPRSGSKGCPTCGRRKKRA